MSQPRVPGGAAILSIADNISPPATYGTLSMQHAINQQDNATSKIADALSPASLASSHSSFLLVGSLHTCPSILSGASSPVIGTKKPRLIGQDTNTATAAKSPTTSSIPRAAIPTLPEGDVPDNLHVPFVHLYRAELGRVTAYRQRLDTVTNWAISLTGLLVTFTLSRDEVSHYFFSVILLLNILFLYTESRRYTFYELALRRCRIVETGWIGIITHSPIADLQWKQKLGAAYGTHPGLLPFHKSCLIRLQRNYIWMFWTVMVGWTIKLSSLDDFPWLTYLPFVASKSIAIVYVLISKFHGWLDV